MPKVSIIMPVYNGAKYIGEAIGSVLAQSYKDWELIVVDDGSTDGTENIVASLGVPLKFLKQQNQGPSAARNLGLQVATGDYVVFLDADDTWNQTFLDITVKELDRLGETVIGIATGWVYTDQNGMELTHTRITKNGYLSLKELLASNQFPIHAILVHRNLLLSVNGFDTQLWGMEDWDLWLRLAAMGGHYSIVETCLAQYRLHNSNNSRQPDKMQRGRLKALEKLFRRGDLPSDIQLIKPWALGRALIQNSVELYAVGLTEEALANFSEAISLCPDLLVEDEIHYAVICAEQPVNYKKSGYSLDLIEGERRILEALEASFRVMAAFDAKWRHRAYSKAFLTLGRLAYGQRQMGTARRFLYRALKHDISFSYRSGYLLILAKSFLGRRWVDTLKGLKDHTLVKSCEI